MLWVCFFLLGEVTAPLFNNCVARVSKNCSFLTGRFVHLFDGSVWVTMSFFLTVERVASFTAMKNASVIFIHSVTLGVKTIYIVGLCGSNHSSFTIE